MKKHRLSFILLLSVFILALSFALLKLEKKQTPLAPYTIILKPNHSRADSILQTYGSTIYQISPVALVNGKTSPSLFLESKLFAPAVNKPVFHYCATDSSLGITIYTNYLNPCNQDIIENPTRNNKLAAILLKYQ